MPKCELCGKEHAEDIALFQHIAAKLRELATDTFIMNKNEKTARRR